MAFRSMKRCLCNGEQNSELPMPQTPLCPSTTSSGFQLAPVQALSCESQGRSRALLAHSCACSLSNLRTADFGFHTSFPLLVYPSAVPSPAAGTSRPLLTGGAVLPPNLP